MGCDGQSRWKLHICSSSVVDTFIVAQFGCNVNCYNKVSEKLCNHTKSCCNSLHYNENVLECSCNQTDYNIKIEITVSLTNVSNVDPSYELLVIPSDHISNKTIYPLEGNQETDVYTGINNNTALLLYENIANIENQDMILYAYTKEDLYAKLTIELKYYKESDFNNKTKDWNEYYAFKSDDESLRRGVNILPLGSTKGDKENNRYFCIKITAEKNDAKIKLLFAINNKRIYDIAYTYKPLFYYFTLRDKIEFQYYFSSENNNNVRFDTHFKKLYGVKGKHISIQNYKKKEMILEKEFMADDASEMLEEQLMAEKPEVTDDTVLETEEEIEETTEEE